MAPASLHLAASARGTSFCGSKSIMLERLGLDCLDPPVFAVGIGAAVVGVLASTATFQLLISLGVELSRFQISAERQMAANGRVAFGVTMQMEFAEAAERCRQPIELWVGYLLASDYLRVRTWRNERSVRAGRTAAGSADRASDPCDTCTAAKHQSPSRNAATRADARAAAFGFSFSLAALALGN